MRLAVFDIGGTSVKTGIYDGKKIIKQPSFATPQTFAGLIARMHDLVDQDQFTGIALSTPGDVNSQTGEIEGSSMVPYLHKRPIFTELEAEFGLPVAIENDANCAGICEMKIGSGRQFDNVAFIVIGTGIGGAVFLNHQLYQGAHLTGGEFGFMSMDAKRMLSMDATIVKAASDYQKQTGQPTDGNKLFLLAQQGDQLAQKLISHFYDVVATATYNLQVAFDFDAFILGGGVSARSEISHLIAQKLKTKLAAFRMERIMPQVKVCQYHNTANLYGAAFNFLAKTK